MQLTEISSIEFAGEKETFDLEVEIDHSYIAQGLVVHNSCSAPNLQTVPARNDRYKVKSCFEAPKGELIICLDFSQIELRVMALMSQDPVMCKVLNDMAGDIHATTASNLNIPRDPVAKQCNFLLIFGGGAKALCQRLRMEGHNASEFECQEFINGFNSLYERIPAFREECFAYHRKNGYIPLLTGRRRIIEDIDSTNRYKRHLGETQLANNLVQGSAQDLMKALILRCDFYRPNFDKVVPTQLQMESREHIFILRDQAKLVDKYRAMFKKSNMRWRLQVHDEVIYTSNAVDALDCGHAISHMMTFRHYFEPMYPMCVMIRGDGGVGENWMLAKKPLDLKLKIHSPKVEMAA